VTGRPAGLVLAAGEGSRLGEPKALVRLGDQLLVERAVRLLRDGGCDPVVVVVGAAAEEVRAQAGLDDAVVVGNPQWPEGMGSSLRAGLAALAEGPADAAVIVLVDQPFVQPEAVRRLVAAWRDGATAVVATYGGMPRNPVLLDRSVWEDAGVAAIGDQGARAWLRDHPERVTPVACDGCGTPDDIDTPEDLARVRAADRR
jgi:CTP:molybdopterin cytidylyltransferase MocA